MKSNHWLVAPCSITGSHRFQGCYINIGRGIEREGERERESTALLLHHCAGLSGWCKWDDWSKSMARGRKVQTWTTSEGWSIVMMLVFVMRWAVWRRSSKDSGDKQIVHDLHTNTHMYNRDLIYSILLNLFPNRVSGNCTDRQTGRHALDTNTNSGKITWSSSTPLTRVVSSSPRREHTSHEPLQVNLMT